MVYIHFILAVFLLGYLSFTTALTVGSCTLNTDGAKTKSYFDMNRLKGTWYQYAVHYNNDQGRSRLPCTTYRFAQPILGEIILTVTETTKNNERSTSSKLSQEANAIYSTEPARSESGESSEEENESRGIFAVVDTDYECWAVTYWCEQKKPSDTDSVITMSVFLKNKSDKCLNGKSMRSYDNIMAQFMQIDLNNIKWQDMNRCKMEESEKTVEQPEKKETEQRQPEKEEAKQPEKKKTEQPQSEKKDAKQPEKKETEQPEIEKKEAKKPKKKKTEQPQSEKKDAKQPEKQETEQTETEKKEAKEPEKKESEQPQSEKKDAKQPEKQETEQPETEKKEAKEPEKKESEQPQPEKKETEQKTGRKTKRRKSKQ